MRLAVEPKELSAERLRSLRDTNLIAPEHNEMELLGHIAFLDARIAELDKVYSDAVEKEVARERTVRETAERERNQAVARTSELYLERETLEEKVAEKDAALETISSIYCNREMSTRLVATEMCRVACEALKDSQ